MKKIFYISLVAMALTSMACSQYDEPQTSGNSATTSIPEDCQAISLSVEIPEETELRSRDLFNGWFSSNNEMEFFHYKIYQLHDDGTRTTYACSEDKPVVVQHNIGVKYSMSLQLPKGTRYEAYFALDGYDYKDQERCFTIDWDNAVIEVDHSKAMGKLDFGDLYTGYVQFDVDYKNVTSSYNVALRRPQLQMNVLSSDTRKDDIKEAFADGMRTYIYFKDADGNPCLPYRWHWDGTIEFKNLTEEEILANTSMNLELSKYYVNIKGTIYDYWYSGYFFAPVTQGDWESVCSNGIVPKSLVFKYGYDDGRIFNEMELSKTQAIDKLGANHRIVIMSKNNSLVKYIAIDATEEGYYFEEGKDAGLNIN